MSIKHDNELRQGVEEALTQGKKVIPNLLYFFQMTCFVFFMIAPAMVGWKMSELTAKANGTFDWGAFLAWAAIVTAAEMALIQGGSALATYAKSGSAILKYPTRWFLTTCLFLMILCGLLSSTSGVIRYAMYMDSTTNREAQSQIDLLKRQMQVHIDYLDARTDQGLVSDEGKMTRASKEVDRLRRRIEKLQDADASPVTAGQQAIAAFINTHFSALKDDERGVTRQDVTLVMFTMFAFTCAFASLTFAYVAENTTCRWVVQRAARRRLQSLHDDNFNQQNRTLNLESKRASAEFMNSLKRRFSGAPATEPPSDDEGPSARQRGGGNPGTVSPTRIKNRAKKLLISNPKLQVKTAVARANSELTNGGQIDTKRRDRIAKVLQEELDQNKG